MTAQTTNTKWYTNYGDGSTTGYYAVAKWTATHAYSVGNLIRQNTAPSTGNERVFVCIVAGTSGSTEPTWTVTKGAKNTDNTVTWQECTGIPAVNGDSTNAPAWLASGTTTLGQIVTEKTSPAHLFICTTAGTNGSSEPTWNTTTGGTTTDNTTTWTCLGTFASFSAWGAPFARLQSAVAANWMAAGDTCFIGDNHAETQAANMTITPPGSAASPNLFLCVDHTAAVPPGAANLTTGASVTAIALNINNGHAYWYGISFVSTGTGNSPIQIAASSNPFWYRFENCLFWLNTASTTANMNFGPSLASRSVGFEFVNTPLKFGNASQSVNAECGVFRWWNTSNALQGTVPTTLFNSPLSGGGYLDIRGVDLSGLGSNTLLSTSATGAIATYIYLENCKLGSGTVVAGGTAFSNQSLSPIRLVNCDSGGTNYKYRLTCYQGDIYDEETVVRANGATDGTTAVSRKMVTTANSQFYSPLQSDPIVFWNSSLAAITVTVPIITDNVTLKNTDAWIEVEYPGTPGSSLSKLDTASRAATVLTSGTNQPTDSASAWTTTGLGTPVKQSLSTTITPTGAGPIKVRVMLARPSTTMWFDPKVISSPKRSYMVGGSGGYINCEPVLTKVRHRIGDRTH